MYTVTVLQQKRQCCGAYIYIIWYYVHLILTHVLFSLVNFTSPKSPGIYVMRERYRALHIRHVTQHQQM